MKISMSLIACIVLPLLQSDLRAQTIVEKEKIKMFSLGPDGKLVYSEDEKKNRLIGRYVNDGKNYRK